LLLLLPQRLAVSRLMGQASAMADPCADTICLLSRLHTNAIALDFNFGVAVNAASSPLSSTSLFVVAVMAALAPMSLLPRSEHSQPTCQHCTRASLAAAAVRQPYTVRDGAELLRRQGPSRPPTGAYKYASDTDTLRMLALNANHCVEMGWVRSGSSYDLPKFGPDQPRT
jgi:hypothetical protein